MCAGVHWYRRKTPTVLIRNQGRQTAEMPGGASLGRLLRGGEMGPRTPACVVPPPPTHHAGGFHEHSWFSSQTNAGVLLFPCINHILLFSIFDDLTSWSLADSGGTAPPRANELPEKADSLSGTCQGPRPNPHSEYEYGSPTLALPRHHHLPYSPHGQVSGSQGQTLCLRARWV